MKLGVGVRYFLIVSLAMTVWHTSAQAPGDEDTRCLIDRVRANDVYPPSTKMLMDSRNYEELISGSRPHWQQLDVDGKGFGWTSTLGGLCAYEARVCDFREGSPQDNWVFTQYIRYFRARQVFINVSAGFTECRLAQNPRCNQLYVDVYRYERNGRNDAAARTTSNYQLIQRIQQPNGFAQRTYRTSFTFIPSGNFNGFYIGVRATGTCINVQRLQVYSRASPRRIVDLVTYPEIALPILSSTTPVTGIATCAANSRNLTSLRVTCFANGTCEDIATCACNPGYEYVASTPAQCRACPAGSYRSRSDPADSCVPCPANTTTSGVAVAICSCIAGHFRAPQDDPKIGCARPPTAVRNLRVTVITSDAITIEWEPPLVGNPVFYYVVEHSDPDDISKYILRTENLIDNLYILDRMRSFTTYIIRVSVRNSVSDQDPQNAALRTVEIDARTKQGLSSPPSNVKGLCRVVLWGQPSLPNGEIERFDVQFYVRGRSYGTVREKERDNIYHIVQDDDKPSGYRDNEVSVGVRAVTGPGPGVWSNVSLGCEDNLGPEPCPTCPPVITCPPVVECPPVPEVTCPTCPPVITFPPVVECPSVPEVTCPTQPPATPPAQVESVDVFYAEDEGAKLVVWNTPEGEVTAYSIRISYSENGFTRRQFSSSENPWIQLRLADLPSQRPLWVEVRARNSAGSAPWSSRVELCMDKEDVPTTQPPPVIRIPAQVESVDMFYDEDEETKLVMWKTPEGEVTTYSIRISYYDTSLRRQYLKSDNPWIQLRLTDLPSQRPLWIEIRARNSAGSAPWSSRVELCADEEEDDDNSDVSTTQPTSEPTTQPTTTPTTKPTTPPVVITRPGAVEKIWAINLEGFWDPPSNTGGEITSYDARIRYTRNGIPRYYYGRNIDPTVRQWKPDPFPSERPIYIQVRARNSAGTGPWSALTTLAA